MSLAYAPDDLERCREHPSALVRHVYDADFYVLNGEAAPVPFRKRHVRYECSACGRELRAAEQHR
jgi:hypothetical protein